MSKRAGFTIIEIVIAIIVLSVGLIGLVTTAALVTRMIAQGQRYSNAATLANRRFEILRAGGCSNMAAGSDTTGTYYLSWTVTSINSGGGNRINMTVTSATGRGRHTDLFTTTVSCL